MNAEDGRRPDGECGAGRSADLGELWCAHRRWVAAVILAHMPRDADLEDLLQDVALVFVSRACELRHADALRPWLRTVAINEARSAGRKRCVRENAREPLPAELAGEEVDARESTANRLRQVLEMTRRLPVKYAEPLLLQALDGMSQQQVAETLGLSVAAVETRLARARRMLRERMARAEDAVACPGRTEDGGRS